MQNTRLTMKKFLVAAGIAVLLAGCLKNNDQITNPACTYDACANPAPATQIQSLKDSLDARGITATQHCSGVFYTIDSAGSATGKTPTPCSYIAITYKGTLLNGTVFDQQAQPVAFDLSTLIPGWRNVLPLIKEGGKMHLYIPPALGYGSQDRRDANGNIVIPANSNLVFEVSLLAVQ